MNDPKETEARAVASVIMWLGYLVIVYIGMTTLGTWSALIAFVVMMPLIAAMGMMWGAFKSDKEKSENAEILSAEEIEKRKRERIDAVLRDFSNEDLIRLKERLGDGTVTDDLLYKAIIGDDGELHYSD